MTPNGTFAHQLRLRRLCGHGDQRLFVVPMDHSISDGPLAGRKHLDDLVGQISGTGVDAVVLHKGRVRHLSPRWFAELSLIVHISASTSHAPDPDAKYLVASVEECLRLGADAVSVHVNLGSGDERHQIADLAVVSDACDTWNMPLLAMVYPRGPRIDNPRDPELVAHAVTLAADLGADVVKTVYVGSTAEMTDIVDSSPIPVLVAGGSARTNVDAVLSDVDHALRAGVAGVAMGRNVFQAADPGAMARRVAGLVHGDRGRGTAASIRAVR